MPTGIYLHKRRSEETKKKISAAQKGEKNHSWKGGVTLIRRKTQFYVNQRHQKLAKRDKPNQCEVCGAIGRICFDHNHHTNKFRGWICVRCNFVLEQVKDNKELLKALIEYLENDGLL